jgi:hypothetical protein
MKTVCAREEGEEEGNVERENGRKYVPRECMLLSEWIWMERGIVRNM